MGLQKLVIVAGVTLGLLLIPISVAAVTAPPEPKVCSRHNQSPVAQGLCDTFNYVRGIHAEVNALATRLAGQEAKTAELKAAATVRDQKIADMESRIAELERKVATQDPCHGYPANLCNAPMDTIVDPWGFYNRQSVSYVAYKISASGRHMPFGFGNANQWPAQAQARGISVDSSPQVGDAAISTAGAFGHAMYVEEVLENGTKVRLGQFNADGQGRYSEVTRSAAGLSYIHF
jgi:surface antigen